MRIAIVHPWFLAEGGAEKTVYALTEAFPDADIFTLLYEKKRLPRALQGRNIKSLNIQWLPAKFKLYRLFLPFYPLAYEALDLRGYDVVITSDSGVVKGVQVDQNAIHICYCHSPMRSLYDQYWDYYESFPALARPFFALTVNYLRPWDFIAAQKVTCMVANSRHIAQRIRAFYARGCKMIYPPVDTHNGYIDSNIGDYYLSVGRLTAAKRIDVLIRACNEMEKHLIIAGSGRELPALKKIAGKTIEFAGRVPDAELSRLYAQCRAFLFSADEDFGIVPVEAQSYGRPVIALARGGALETVIDSVTGLHFAEPTAESLKDAILRFEAVEHTFDPQRIQQHARTFDAENFKSSMSALVESLVQDPKRV